MNFGAQLLGQLLTDVDYAMKSIWHGVGISKGKREKLSERWRTLLDVNTSSGEYDKNSKDPLEEFEIAGLQNLIYFCY